MLDGGLPPIDLAREAGGTVDEVDRRKALLRAKSVAEYFIQCANREIAVAKT